MADLHITRLRRTLPTICLALSLLMLVPPVSAHDDHREYCTIGGLDATDAGDGPETAKDVLTSCDGHFQEDVDEVDYFRGMEPQLPGSTVSSKIYQEGGNHYEIDFGLQARLYWIDASGTTLLDDATIGPHERAELTGEVPADATLSGRAYVEVTLAWYNQAHWPDEILNYSIIL